MNISKAVRWVREQRGLNNKEFSEKSGWARSVLWKIESRLTMLRPETMEVLCRVLEIDVEVLYYLTLVFETKGKMMEMGVDITPLLIHHLKKKYNLDLNEIVGI